MDKEKQIKFLKTLGYTIKETKIEFGNGDFSGIKWVTAAFKGEEPEFLGTGTYKLETVFYKEREELLYNIMMDKIAEKR